MVNRGARRAVARRHRPPGWLREVVLVAVLYGGYELSRTLTHSTLAEARIDGRAILRWERGLGLAPEHLLTHGLVAVTPLAVLAAYFYSTMHYLVTPAVLVWLYRSHRPSYGRARTALAVSTALGVVGFSLLPTAPPRLLVGAGIPDALSAVRNWGWWGGEGSVPRGLGSLANQYAAMPSLHVGWALWCGWLIHRHASRGRVRALGVAYPLLTALVVLATGNHYLLDVLAGGLVMVVGAGVAGLAGAAGAAVARVGTGAVPGRRAPARAAYARPAVPLPWALFGGYATTVVPLRLPRAPAHPDEPVPQVATPAAS